MSDQFRISKAKRVKLQQITQMSEVQFPTWDVEKGPDHEIFAPMSDASA